MKECNYKYKYYKIGGHTLCLRFGHNTYDESLLPSFSPFEVDSANGQILFILTLTSAIVSEDTSMRSYNCGGCIVKMNRTEDNAYFVEIQDQSQKVCAKMIAKNDFQNVEVALPTLDWKKKNFGLNCAMMIAFAYACADKHTILMHASVIRNQEKGYLMIAPSGTGKSTHTRMWYDHIPGCDLINDDNPVVRVINGEVTVYGSPWSGKTPCYRNVNSLVGAIVRIVRSSENSIKGLPPVQAFTQLLNSTSNMKWDERTYRGICDTISEVVNLVSVYELKCLPNADAARLCFQTVSMR